MADIAGDTSTTARLLLDTTIVSAIDATTDIDTFRVDLVAGRTYEFRMHGYGVAEQEAGTLTLRATDGATVLAANDFAGGVWDGTNDHDPRIVYTPATSGTHYLSASNGATPDTGLGRYMLTAVERDPAGMVFTPDEIAWQLVNNYNEGGYRACAWDVGGDGALTVDLAGLDTAGRTLARAALAMWSDVAGIAFVETTAAAEIVFDDVQDGGFAYWWVDAAGSTTITSSKVNVGRDILADRGTTVGSGAFEVYVHEIGHALGLGHGGNYDRGATYGTNDLYLNDSLAWSVMSYFLTARDADRVPRMVNTTVDADFRTVLTPQIADVIAIKAMYGDRTATRTGATTYGYNADTGNEALDMAASLGSDMAMTVYDDGGVDRLDFSGARVAQRIDLSAGSFSNVLGGRMNLAIARGTVIEEAFGGAAADRIAGNAVGNRVAGNGGADTLAGNAGDDALDGGGGDDGAAGNGGADTLSGGDGTDTLDGGRGNDRLGGGTGRDRLSGAAGNDTLAGGVEADTLFGGSEHDSLTGEDGADKLAGDAGADTLSGGAGADRLAGGLGNDRIVGGAGSDRIVFADGDRSDRIADFADGSDRIDLSDFDFASFAAVRALATNTSAGLVLSFGDGDRLLVENFISGDFNAFDVIL